MNGVLRFRGWMPLALLSALILGLGAFATVRQDAFLTEYNIQNLLLTTLPLALVAIGQTNALLVCGFDVSVAALMGLLAVFAFSIRNHIALLRHVQSLAADEPTPLEAVSRERDELRDRLLRKTADFENYCKRVERERRDFAEWAAADLVNDVLAVIDDFERALAVDAPRRPTELPFAPTR